MPVVLEMSEEYYSLQHMKNRIKPAKTMVDLNQKQITIYLEERVKEFLAQCRINNDGYLILRTRRPGLQIIAEYLKKMHPQMSVQQFSCDQKNIPMLNTILDTKPIKPTVLLISGSIRAGKTLTTTKHIRMWLDSPVSKSDTTCQSVGRCLGYASGGHSKFNDKFFVYCCADEIDECIEFFNKYNCSPNVPSGNWNKSHSSEIEQGEYVKLPHTHLEEVRDLYQDYATVLTCSKNSKNNIAEWALNGINRGNTKGTKGLRILYLDAPSPNFPNDFERLSKEKPEFVGSFLIFKIKKRKNETNLEKALHKDAGSVR